MLDFGALQLDEDDGLLGAEKIIEDAQNFKVELFDLVAGKDSVCVALHSRVDLAEGKDFFGFLRACEARHEDVEGQERQEREGKRAAGS